MDWIVRENLRQKVFDILGGTRSSAAAHEPPTCAETVRDGL